MGGGGEKRKFLFFLTLHAPSCSLALVLHCNEQAIQLGEDKPTGKSIKWLLTLDTGGKLQEFFLKAGLHLNRELSLTEVQLWYAISNIIHTVMFLLVQLTSYFESIISVSYSLAFGYNVLANLHPCLLSGPFYSCHYLLSHSTRHGQLYRGIFSLSYMKHTW